MACYVYVQACEQVFEKTKECFDKNIDKFKIYAMRNIFVPYVATNVQATSSTSNASGGASSSATDAQLLQLRQTYLSLQSEQRELTDSCRDTDFLLKDMRSTLFSLRVGIQAFDDYNIPETVAGITLQRERLLQMCKEAQGR